MYAIKCQQFPSTLYTQQTGQSLCKRIIGINSDIKNHNTQTCEGTACVVNVLSKLHSDMDKKIYIMIKKLVSLKSWVYIWLSFKLVF